MSHGTHKANTQHNPYIQNNNIFDGEFNCSSLKFISIEMSKIHMIKLSHWPKQIFKQIFDGEHATVEKISS